MSIFFDEWRDCLQEHYLYVLRTHDWVTEKTLRDVLIKVGVFPEEIIYEMQDFVLGEEAAMLRPVAIVEEQQIIEEEIYEEEIIIEEMPEALPPQEPDEPPPNKFQQRSLF